MALAQALRSMPVGALHVRFPKQLDGALGKPPRTSKEPSALAGSKLVPLMVSVNGWLAMAGFGVVSTLVMVGRLRGSTRNDANGEAVGDRPLAVLRTITLSVPTVPILTVVRCSLYRRQQCVRVPPNL
jgi:hypothetical protein